jgi:hypothetical protein
MKNFINFLGTILMFLTFTSNGIVVNAQIADNATLGNLIYDESETPFKDIKQSDCGVQQFSGNDSKSEKFLNDYPEEAIFKNPDNQNSFELINMRDKYTKYFQNDDGSFSFTRSAMKPYHFEQNENLLTYDESLIIQNSRYQLKNTDLNIFLHQETGEATFELLGGDIEFLDNSKSFYVLEDGSKFSYANRNNSSVSSGQILNDKIVFSDYFSDNIDKTHRISWVHFVTTIY